MYKNYNISIEVTCSEEATHIVELLYADRKSVNYYKVTFETLNRKPKSDDYIEPMPKKQLQRIIKDFKAKGGIILINDEVDEYLKKQHAEGSTLNENTILLVRNPGRSAVYEELIHAKQYADGKNDGSRKSRLRCEIEAQKMLIEHKEEWHITDKEDKQTRRVLKRYEQEYKKLNERR